MSDDDGEVWLIRKNCFQGAARPKRRTRASENCQRRGFPRFLDETAKSLNAECLATALADCVKLRALSREQNDYIAVCLFDVAINHINAEIARRNVKADHI